MRVLVTGATGFIGRALVPALAAAGDEVRGATRRLRSVNADSVASWVECDLRVPETLPPAFDGVECAYYLVHSMGADAKDFRDEERRSAEAFAQAAWTAGCRRIVYLGGVAPRGNASAHLASRLEVGEILRSAFPSTLELRAGMIIGNGSASWQIVRDLALRLPAMVLPQWLDSKSCPIALQDVISALVDARTLMLPESAWFDLPGLEVISGRDILLRIASIRGRRIPHVRVPVLTPALSALWLKLITRADYHVGRELVKGLTGDLLPRDARYWELTGHPPEWTFDAAARHTLETERAARDLPGRLAVFEEYLVHRFGPHDGKWPRNS